MADDRASLKRYGSQQRSTPGLRPASMSHGAGLKPTGVSYAYTWPGPTLSCPLCDGYGWNADKKDGNGQKCPWSFSTNVIDGSGWICKMCHGLGNIGPEEVKTHLGYTSVDKARRMAKKARDAAAAAGVPREADGG